MLFLLPSSSLEAGGGIKMGRLFLVELEGSVYSCLVCRSHLALVEELISRSFQCHRGKAYLFNTVVNVWTGDEEDRALLSGSHTVADLFCCCCGQNVGWKYVATHDLSQKYKEGKFVLERGKIVAEMDLDILIDTNDGSDNDNN